MDGLLALLARQMCALGTQGIGVKGPHGGFFAAQGAEAGEAGIYGEANEDNSGFEGRQDDGGEAGVGAAEHGVEFRDTMEEFQGSGGKGAFLEGEEELFVGGETA